MTREEEIRKSNGLEFMKTTNKYHMSFADAQEYVSKRGFDIPWNDCDVFIDEREITRTVGNVLKWADEHPKNPWISVKDDLPCNHAEMLHPMCNIKTQYVITSIGGLCYINNMLKYRDKWIWEMDKPTHWMPIPKLPKE